MKSTKERRRKPHIGTILGLLGALLWVVTPALTLVLLSQRSAEITATEAEPVWVQVEQNSDSTDAPVGVQLFWSAPPAVVAPAWSGLVQEVLVSPGSIVVSGTPIAVVDGVRRLAVNTPRPFAQAVSYEQVGPEVTMLTVMLRGLGYEVDESDTYGPQVAGAVKALATDIGVVKPDGRTFDPGWVVYLSTTELAVSSVDLTVAEPAPGPGSPIISARSQLSTALLTQADAVKEILGAETPSPATGDSLVVPAAGQVLVVGSAEIPLTPDQAEVPVAALPLIEPQVQSLVNAVQANIRTESNPDALVVPSSAVFASPSGATCVVTDRAGAQSVHAQVISQGGGRTVITGDLDVSDRVQIMPPAVERTCN